MKEKFTIPPRMKTWSWGLMGVGVLTLILGFIFMDPFYSGPTQHLETTRFWASLIQDSVFFFLVSTAVFLFIVAHALAMAGWHTALRRVPEAISGYMITGGIVLVVVLFVYVFLVPDHYIYTWKTFEHPLTDPEIIRKKGFLGPGFFVAGTLGFMLVWILCQWYYRRSSIQEDLDAKGNRRHFRKTLTISGIFLVTYGIGISSAPSWLWVMSIDAHWASTLFGWYQFATTWVSAFCLITLFVIYLKNQGYLEWVNEEHLHDLGKYIFAFSIFWTYLWFAQYFLYWYGNIPEETTYFQIRLWGAFRPIFLLELIINFVCPILILMTRDSKRTWSMMTFMAVLVLFGHWLDYYQEVMAGPLGAHAKLGWYEFGVLAGFVGLIIWVTGKQLEKAPMVPLNSPFIKESIIHHT